MDYKNVIQKSNGNLVLAHNSLWNDHTISLTEIDLSGSVVRQFQSLVDHTERSFVDVADDSGRLMIGKPFEGIELLDSELNLLGVFCPAHGRRLCFDRMVMRYDRNRNEIARIHFDWGGVSASLLTVFRFTEE